MHDRFLAAFAFSAIAVLFAGEARAQFQGPSLAGSVYLDRILRTEQSSEEAEEAAEVEGPERAPRGMRSMTEGAGEEAAGEAARKDEEKPFWSPPMLTVGYVYFRKDSSLADDTESDRHQVLAQLHIENERRFSTDFAVSYVRSDDEDAFSNTSDGNSYVLTITPAQELLGVIRKKAPEATGLIAGLLVGYRHTDADGQAFGNKYSADVDALNLVPALTLAQGLSRSPRIVLSETALYLYETSDKDLHGVSSTDESTGVFALQTRLDVHIPGVARHGDVAVIPTAQWDHDVHRDAGATKDDWAEFGLKVRWPLPNKGGIVAAYNVETLRRDYTTHSATLAFEWQL